MGWCHEVDAEGRHEGYLVGLVKCDDGWRLRELGPDDAPRTPLQIVQVACDCGWRSSRLLAPFGYAQFSPCVVLRDTIDRETFDRWENQCRELWDAHVRAEVGAAARSEGPIRI